VHRSRGFGAGFDVYKHGRERERALAWLDGHGRRKWFLFYHTYQVHDPYLPPPALIDRFDPDYRGPVRDTVERIRARFGDWEKAHQTFWAGREQWTPRDVRFVARLYDAGIRNMDDTTLTALLDRLEARGLARDTLVVFTSDHGEAFGEHGRFLHDDVHEETVRVPLVLRFPGRLPAGRRIAAQAAVLDVMPTVLDLLHVPAPPSLQGRSLRPLLDGDAPDEAAISTYAGMTSVRRGGLTLLADGTGEHLFDAPAEAEDVAAARPADVAALRGVLAASQEDCRRLGARFGPGGATVAPDAETTRRLRALGYVR
jgi:arylsulfatase A-like enzyme